MSEIAIKVENLSKRYRIGLEEELPDTLMSAVTQAIKRPLRNWRRLRRLTNFEETPERSNVQTSKRSNVDDTLWALKDVSFEVQRGEVVGIIGRNGAGKSTLLKILARITHPTSGRAVINGRVGSLLEVGTGFHPELTGRENIYLNGTILGMTKAEVDRKFDEIVDFSGVEKFIDTPVKRYSSGMRVRLAFSVAAHLDPEILLVDEVLAVGDAAFQKKCLGKMGEVASEGRTVLFVSHNMGAVMQLCPQSLLLEEGCLVTSGESNQVVKRYLSNASSKGTDIILNAARNPESPIVLTRCWIGDSQGQPISTVSVTEPFTIGLKVLVREEISGVEMSIRVHNGLGLPLFNTRSGTSKDGRKKFEAGENIAVVSFPGEFLAPGHYSSTIGIHKPHVEVFDLHEHLLTFEVEESGSDMWQYRSKQYGNILVNFPWKFIDSDSPRYIK